MALQQEQPEPALPRLDRIRPFPDNPGSLAAG
jgi:hypothetical protein